MSNTILSIGRDAVQALKAYLSDMQSRGVEFRYDTPLFLKERGKEDGLTPNLVARAGPSIPYSWRSETGKVV